MQFTSSLDLGAPKARIAARRCIVCYSLVHTIQRSNDHRLATARSTTGILTPPAMSTDHSPAMLLLNSPGIAT